MCGFEPDEAVRVATDSIYVRKSALHKLKGVEAYMAPKRCDCGKDMCVLCLLEEDYLPPVAPAQWQGRESLHAHGTCSLPRQAWLDLFWKGPHSQHRAAPRWPAVEAPLDLPKRRRGLRQNHASDRALPCQKSPRLHPDPSPGQRDAGQGRSGPDLS